jgi:hypothetical protein
MKPFAATGPAKGALTTTVFRSSDQTGGLAEARRYLLSHIDAAGLGVRPQRRVRSSHAP